MFFSTCCCSQGSEVRVDLEQDEKLVVPNPESDFDAPTLLSSPRGRPLLVHPATKKAEPRSAPEVQFAEIAHKGHREAGPCLLIDEANGERLRAEYRVDADDSCLVLKVFRENFVQQIACPIALIEDIFQIEDGDICFPLPVLEAMSLEERCGLFMIVSSGFHVDGDHVEREVAVNVVVGSEELRANLLEYLRALI